MARNDLRAAFGELLRDDQIDQLVQRLDDPVDVTAAREVDAWIARGHVHIACADHVGAAKEHQRVAVGVRARHVNQLDRFAVEIHVLAILEERVRGPRGERKRRLARLGCAQRVQDVLVRHDECAAGASRAKLAEEVSGNQLRARRGNLRVAPGVIGMGVRVDDVANRLAVRERRDRLQQRISKRVGHGVDDEDALWSDLDRRVAIAARHQVHLSMNWQHLDACVRARGIPGGPRRLRMACRRQKRRDEGRNRESHPAGRRPLHGPKHGGIVSSRQGGTTFPCSTRHRIGPTALRGFDLLHMN
jgi:hypothetical protein